MSKDGEWGDHLVLVALANVLGRTIRVVTSQHSDHIFVKPVEQKGAEILLGHISEFHYESLEPMNNVQGKDEK